MFNFRHADILFHQLNALNLCLHLHLSDLLSASCIRTGCEALFNRSTTCTPPLPQSEWWRLAAKTTHCYCWRKSLSHLHIQTLNPPLPWKQMNPMSSSKISTEILLIFQVLLKEKQIQGIHENLNKPPIRMNLNKLWLFIFIFKIYL